MKFIDSFSLSQSLDSAFEDHLKKFEFKRDQELILLNDIKTFIEKKSRLQMDYANNEIRLCEEFLNKTYKKINEHEEISEQSVPIEFRNLLEQFIQIAEKRQASSSSMFYLVDYFEKMRKQKDECHKKAMANLKKIQDDLKELQNSCKRYYKNYCFEEYLNESLNCNGKEMARLHDRELKKKLKSKSIDVKYFNEKLKKLSDDTNPLVRIRTKQVDLTKLNYYLNIKILNQSYQHYISSYLPDLCILENGKIDLFIRECFSSLAQKERDTSRFTLDTFALPSLDQAPTHSDDIIMLNKTVTFERLVQFEPEQYDSDKEEFTIETIKSEHAKFFAYDYQESVTKLNSLTQLISTLSRNIDTNELENRLRSNQTRDLSDQDEEYDGGYFLTIDVAVESTTMPMFMISERIENEKYKVSELKFQMVILQSKIDILESFNIQQEIDKNDNDIYTYEEIAILKNELDDLLIHQCLFYVESYVRTIGKPFHNPEDYNFFYDSWL